ncbi:MerR family transcriptional regulator [Streptomyces sp. NPDC051132]|uniref:MerR family transcriptional regulator n=1 Tax=unclassified Streptomyces TaxID=2593676 RepID=UPI0034429CBA
MASNCRDALPLSDFGRAAFVAGQVLAVAVHLLLKPGVLEPGLGLGLGRGHPGGTPAHRTAADLRLVDFSTGCVRIGEIAALVGLTIRANRHYHHVGLLPEPERRPNGYRAYSVRDAVLLARVRRLTELDLSLDEVRDALGDDAGRGLAEVLEELDTDLVRQEADIRERRCRLSALFAEPPGATGPVSPALAALLAEAPRTDSPSAAKAREYLTLMDATSSGSQEIFALLAAYAPAQAEVVGRHMDAFMERGRG